VGCIECKRELWENMVAELRPIQEKARSLAANPALVREALVAGAKRCKAMAEQTMEEVRSRLGLLPLERLERPT
jgi:tryptophanyl-tRNA synthetase